MGEDLYMTLTSKSQNFDNKANNFHVQLKPELCLSGDYSVALVEIFMPTPKKKKKEAKYLMCNFVKSSIVNDTRRPVLRVIYQNKNHIQLSPEYIKVANNTLGILSFELLDIEGNRIQFEEDGDIELRLHFTKTC